MRGIGKVSGNITDIGKVFGSIGWILSFLGVLISGR